MQPGPVRERPRLRQDLFAELIEAQGARFIDVMAPDSGNVFRFYEVEYSLACGMDGERDVPGIVKWAQEELGLTPSQQEVRTVIAALGDLGFIDDEAVQPASAPTPRAAVAPPARPQAPPLAEIGAPSARPVRPTPPAQPAVALGVAGSAAPRSTNKPAAAPSSGVALDAPGARPVRPAPAAIVSPPVPPSPPAMEAATSDVSVDLSDHMAVRPADVKEAVRASRVMAAVEPPPELVEMLPEEPTARGTPMDTGFGAFPEPEFGAAPEPEMEMPPEPEMEMPPEPEMEMSPEPEVEVPADSGFDLPESALGPESIWASESEQALENALGPEIGRQPETRTETSQPGRVAVGRPPVELPQPLAPPVGADKPSPPVARRGTSPVLIIVLVLVILGAGGFFVWKYVLGKASPEARTSAPPPSVVVKPAPPPPAPPPLPSGKIALETPPPDEIRVIRPGVIENIVADKTPVKEGDVIVRLVGDRPIEAELAGLARDQKRLQNQIDRATRSRDAARAAGNAAAEAAAETEITNRQRTLAAKQNQLAAKTAELDNYLIHAPGDGMFSPAVKSGQKVPAAAVVATMQRDAVPVATFKVGDTRTFAANTSVEVAIAKGELRVTCTIADVQPASVKVVCPIDPALTEGTEVTLNVPAAMAAEASESTQTSPDVAPAPAGAPAAAEPTTAPPGPAAPGPGAPPAH